MNTAVRLGPVMVAVEDIDAARLLYQRLWGAEVGDVHEVPEGNMRRCFVSLGPGELQLMQPREGETVLAGFLEKRGPGLYGQIMVTDDIETAGAELQDGGVRTVGGIIEMEDMRELVVHPSATLGVLTVLRQLR